MAGSRVVTTSELDEMVALLYSEKAKTREEGVKTLATILDSAGGLMVLDQQTALLKSSCKITAWSWPGVADALCQCIDTEVGASKKRGPKPVLAKAMRNFVQKAEDPGRRGKSLVLLRKVNRLMKHILYVLQEVPTFILDYSFILRQVILDVEYRVRLNKKVYNALVELFFEKIKAATSSDGVEPKEEAFQSAITLHALLQNPPGDLSDALKCHVVHNFVGIFSQIRDEGRLAKKLLAALNIFLVSNGLNVADLVIKLHSSLRQFLFRTWLTTRDRELKDGLVLYTRAQLQLRHVLGSDDSEVVEELLELVEKELDQTGIALMGMYREDRLGSVTRSMRGFLELAASVIFEAHTRKSPNRDRVKRRRTCLVHTTVKDRLSNSKYFWIGAVSMMIRRRGSLLQKPVLFTWLEGLASGFERALADAANSRSAEILLWTLRCFQEFAILWPMTMVTAPGKKCPMLPAEEEHIWQYIWKSLLHWLPLLSNVPILVEEAFKLLGIVVAQNLVLSCNVPNDFWSTQPFSEMPSGELLFFVIAIFSSPGNQALARDDTKLRSKLIDFTLSALDIQGVSRSKAAGEDMISPRLLSASVLALSIGCLPVSINCSHSFKSASISLLDELGCCLEPELQDRADELELSALDRSEDILAASEDTSVHEMSMWPGLRSSPLPRSKCGLLLQHTALKLVGKAEAAGNSNISQLFHMSATVSACIDGVEGILHKRGLDQRDWSPGGRLWKALANMVEMSISLIDSTGDGTVNCTIASNSQVQHHPPVLVGLQQFTSFGGRGALVQANGLCKGAEESISAEPLLDVLLHRLCQTLQATNELSGNVSVECSANPQLTEPDGKTRILDADLDAMADSTFLSTDRLDSLPGNVKALSGLVVADRRTCSWRFTVMQMVSAIGRVSPNFAIENLLALLQKEKKSKIRLEMLRQVIRLMTGSTLSSLSSVIEIMKELSGECTDMETSKYDLLDGIDVLFTNLLRPACGGQVARDEGKIFTLPEQASSGISNLVAQVADSGMVLWPTRLIMGKVLANFILLDASTAQSHIDRLLGLLNDPEYRVRLKLSKLITVLFETWEGHLELLQDISLNLPTLEASQDNSCSALELSSEVCASKSETALVTLGHLAFASSKVETEVVFRICTYAASSPCHRPLVIAVLDRLAKRLKYATRLKYMEQLLGGILHRWVLSGVALASILEVKHIFSGDLETREFLHQSCPWLLVPLLLEGNINGIEWMSNVVCEPVSALLKQHFPATFAALLLSHLDGNESEKAQAASVLQGSMLRVMEVTEDERDRLIRKNMVSIVHSLFRLCNGADESQRPYFSRAALASAAQAVVDGFLEQDQISEDGTIVDKMQVFRPGKVYALLLQIHQHIQVACDPRHRQYPLASLAALMDIINQRCLVPSTFRYLVHIILQSIDVLETQEQCCLLLGKLLDKIDARPDEAAISVLGDHLQLIVSKLVSCYAEAGVWQPERFVTGSGMSVRGISDHKVLLLSLLHRITTDAHQPLNKYIKELDRFPDHPAFEPMRHLQAGSNLATEFTQFVKRAPNLSPQLRMMSLQSLCQQLPSRREDLYDGATEGARQNETLRCKPEVVSAVWDLLHVCDEQDEYDISEMAAEFLAVINIGDTHAPVSLVHEGFKDVSIDSEFGLHDDTVKMILLQLHVYMTDSDVSNIVLAYRAIKGILATEKGHRVFQSLDLQTKSYLKVCSNGVNQALVEDILSQALSNRESQPLPLEETKLWETSSNQYRFWVCRLVHALLDHTEDKVARLCQETVLQKTALAELMFPHVLGLLAGKCDPEFRVCRQISEQVAEFVFCESNKCTRSIQLFLEAMNCLRVEYVATRMKQLPTTNKMRDSSKGEKGVSSTGKSSRRSGSQGGNTDSSIGNCQAVSDWAKVYWLQIDYLKTAQAAQQCAAYYTSALYVEHWCEETHGTMSLGEPDFSSDDSLPLHVELLLAVCTKTSEPDSIYGVVRSHKLLSQLLVHENEGNWSKAVEGYDLLLRSSRAGSTGPVQGETQEWKYYKGLMRSLQQMGCSHVLAMYYLGLAQQKPAFLDDSEFKELQFEAAWRAGKWDLDYLTTENNSCNLKLRRTASYHAHLYSCLRSLLEGDEDLFFLHLKQSRQDVVSCIAHASMECSQNVNPHIVRLKVLDCLSRAWEMRWRRPLPFTGHDVHRGILSSQQAVAGPLVLADEEVKKLEQVCQDSLKQVRMHYNLVEHIAAVCKTLYGVVSRRDRVPCHLLEFARLSRKAKRLNHAAIALHELKTVSNELMTEANVVHLRNGVSSYLSTAMSAGKVEEAKILWAQGHQELALNLARFVAKNSEADSDLAATICLTGKWLSETRSESSRDILDNYLKKAVELVGGSERHKTSSDHALWTSRQCRTHFNLAHYTDALYRTYVERLSSTEWKSALRLRQHKARELEKLRKRLKAAPKGEQQQYMMRLVELEKQLALDSEEAQHLQDDKNYFLSSCLRSYTTCLTTGNKYDLRVVFRLVSLWFNLPSDPEVVQQMRYTTQKVHSYKFLPLVYQIASRMGYYREAQGSLTFQSALTSLVEKMVIDHPYHSLYQILALANGDRVKAQQRSRNAFVVDMDKKQAAENLLSRMQSIHSALLPQMRKMIEMYIKLAELETKKEHMNKKITVPRDVRSVRQLELIPVITAHVPIDTSCSYSPGTYPFFQGFSDGIQVMHGVNAPKVIECLGSDGHKYRQLAKSGDDDLRQDAVMEQLFGLVNTLLQDHPDTRKRRLSIRTYKVVPFTPSAGVLEWVNGTLPLGEYLLGGGSRTGGAHGRYGEDDWTFGACREKMATEKDKRKTFEKVCQKFRPVMHYFFIEKFSQPAEWFEKRLAYTRSVAASSMVGYIVGLGDRHSMNILLDQASAEVVHIDLGVAFEQGLMLKTPERVPFRLTRDIVDGMGVPGVEGVFRRCCEATLSVMRMNKEALLTIIEVFIHDPLYRWALSPLKALQRQQEVSDGEDSYMEDDDDMPAEVEGNKDAARALGRVKQKLDGYEGEMRSLEGQVQQLIQDSQDPERLCQMFPGWGAWL